MSGSDPSIPDTLALLDTDIETVIAQSKKALRSIHTMAHVDPAARRAFVLCDGVMRKLAPTLKIDLRDWPNVESLVGSHAGGGGKGERKDHGGQVTTDRRESEGRMEGLDDLVDFDGGG